MHDDQLQGLLRSLETGRDPEPAFADALYARLGMVASARGRSRAPMLLLAAALLGILLTGVVVGSGLFRVPFTVEASPTPSAPPADGSPSAQPTPSPATDGLAFEAPEGVLPPNAEVVNDQPLELHQSATADAPVIATVPAGEALLISGPLLVDGARWYNLTWRAEGTGGWTPLDPTEGVVELVPVSCPATADLATLSGMTAWARLACYGDREITLEGYEIVGFGGVRPGSFEPEWLNGFLGEFALSTGEGNALFVRVEPGTVDVSRPRVDGEMGSALLRVTGRLNHPASVECTATDIPITGDPEGETADVEPIAAELECREQFVLTSFQVADEGAPEPSARPTGRVLTATADGLAVREEPSADGVLVGRVNAGQRLGYLAGPVEAEGLEWYSVGPGPLTGWVSSGPDGDWLRLVEDGAIGFVCEEGCGTPALASVTPSGELGRTALTLETYREWSWSPDGTRIVGAFDRGGSVPSQIEVLNVNPLGAGRAIGSGYDPAWSPDGSRLAWTDGSALTVTDDDLAPTQLELDVRVAGRPMWSPDGTRLAFSAIDCPACPEDEPIFGDPPSATWIVNADGSGLRQLLTGGDYSGIVDWSPDGSMMAFIEYDLSGEFPTRAYTLPVDGGERTYLDVAESITAPPTWSPDGAYLAFATEDDLIVAMPDGSSPRVIASSPESGFGTLSWSPSGEWLLYATLGTADGDGPSVWIIPFDGSASARQLSPSGGTARSPAWQPVLVPLP